MDRTNNKKDFNSLCKQVRNCTLCADFLPNAPNPIFHVSPTAKILIVGQAPGNKAHLRTTSWDDRSGDILRKWLNLDREVFYDNSKIAIMSTGFCYPGLDKNGGDRPPRKECAPLWHGKLLSFMPNIKITLLIGGCCFPIYTLGITIVSELLPKDKITKAAAILLFFYSIGAALGPIIASLMIGNFSINMLFLFVAISSSTISLFIWTENNLVSK